MDFLLHTKALLSTITYLSSALPPRLTAARDKDVKKQVEKVVPGRTGEWRRHRCVRIHVAALTGRRSLCSS